MVNAFSHWKQLKFPKVQMQIVNSNCIHLIDFYRKFCSAVPLRIWNWVLHSTEYIKSFPLFRIFALKWNLSCVNWYDELVVFLTRHYFWMNFWKFLLSVSMHIRLHIIRRHCHCHDNLILVLYFFTLRVCAFECINRWSNMSFFDFRF